MGREEDEERKAPSVTYYPHPPTYIIPGTGGRHHDMMMIMVGSEVMAMPGLGLLLLHGR
jgi:hypothetical protein